MENIYSLLPELLVFSVMIATVVTLSPDLYAHYSYPHQRDLILTILFTTRDICDETLIIKKSKGQLAANRAFHNALGTMMEEGLIVQFQIDEPKEFVYRLTHFGASEAANLNP